MALYRCINRGRDRRRRPSVAIDDLALPSPRPQPEEEAGAREEVRTALRVLARLGEACRQLWAMVHEGLSYVEMSERLAVAPGTLRVRVLRCRQKAAEEWRRLTGESR
jgi:RNA polymerase sigma factor (sigma-70 family)